MLDGRPLLVREHADSGVERLAHEPQAKWIASAM
jgi:hypothetical protein